MPTSTVEDYLKCIYVHERERPGQLVATGTIAGALGLAPGTVTAMMKTLTDSGLVTYEPYMGVRLSAPGRELATHVLRRHRLVEQFLVRVMGMNWTEVHAEAEVLEHAVSDRIIERMDEMLGHPATDPHGDPIPTAGGQVEEPNYVSLLACPLERELRIARVTDQRVDFLKLLERNHLIPGRGAMVENRDETAETVLVRSDEGEAIRLGFPAASRILVEVG